MSCVPPAQSDNWFTSLASPGHGRRIYPTKIPDFFGCNQSEVQSPQSFQDTPTAKLGYIIATCTRLMTRGQLECLDHSQIGLPSYLDYVDGTRCEYGKNRSNERLNRKILHHVRKKREIKNDVDNAAELKCRSLRVWCLHWLIAGSTLLHLDCFIIGFMTDSIIHSDGSCCQAFVSKNPVEIYFRRGWSCAASSTDSGLPGRLRGNFDKPSIGGYPSKKLVGICWPLEL